MAATRNVMLRLSEEEWQLIEAARGPYPFATWCRVELVKKANWLRNKKGSTGATSTQPTWNNSPGNVPGNAFKNGIYNGDETMDFSSNQDT